MAQSKAATPSAAAPPDPPAAREQPTRPDASPGGVLDLVEYRPLPGVALPTAGEVAVDNWSGVVGNRRVRVYRGAPASEIPREVVRVMAEYGCKLGTISWQELGIKPPVAAPAVSIGPDPIRRSIATAPAPTPDNRGSAGGF